MAELSESLRQRIRERPDLWREVCVRSLELLEGTNEHVDAVLALHRNPASTKEQFRIAATAATTYAAATYAAAAADYAANAATAAAAHAAYAAANAAAYAATAAKGNKVERFIAELELLVSFAPQQLPEERPHV